MDKKGIYKAIKFLEHCLKETGLEISKIVLFGSQAHGKASKQSDIDIVIVSKDFLNKDIFERAILTKEAEIMTIKKFKIPLDIITMTPEEFEKKDSTIKDYVKDGKVVYG